MGWTESRGYGSIRKIYCGSYAMILAETVKQNKKQTGKFRDNLASVWIAIMCRRKTKMNK
jgi:hypothetical protein